MNAKKKIIINGFGFLICILSIIKFNNLFYRYFEIWSKLTFCFTIIYLIIKIFDYKYNKKSLHEKNYFLFICGILDFLILGTNLYYDININCGYQEICYEYSYIFICLFNIAIRLFIYSLFYFIKCYVNKIYKKFQPITLWSITVLLIIVIPFFYSFFSSMYETSITNAKPEVIFVDDITEIPDDDKYELLDSSSDSANTAYNKFGKYKNKKVKLMGYVYTNIYNGNIYQNFMDYDLYSYYYRDGYLADFFNNFNSYFKISYINDNYDFNDNEVYYVVVYGKIKNKKQIGNYDVSDLEYYNVNIIPSKVYIVKTKTINYENDLLTKFNSFKESSPVITKNTINITDETKYYYFKNYDMVCMIDFKRSRCLKNNSDFLNLQFYNNVNYIFDNNILLFNENNNTLSIYTIEDFIKKFNNYTEVQFNYDEKFYIDNYGYMEIKSSNPNKIYINNSDNIGDYNYCSSDCDGYAKYIYFDFSDNFKVVSSNLLLQYISKNDNGITLGIYYN